MTHPSGRAASPAERIPDPTERAPHPAEAAAAARAHPGRGRFKAPLRGFCRLITMGLSVLPADNDGPHRP